MVDLTSYKLILHFDTSAFWDYFSDLHQNLSNIILDVIYFTSCVIFDAQALAASYHRMTHPLGVA